MFTAAFWLDALERAVRTAAQAALGMITTTGTGLIAANWLGIAETVGIAALVSILMSLTATSVGAPTSASFLTRGQHGKHEAA